MDQQAAATAAATNVADAPNAATAVVAAAPVTAPAAAPAVATAAPIVEPVVAPIEVPPGNVAARKPIHKLVEQFLKLNPPKFIGAGDPKAIALWTKGLEKAFALLMCTEAKKVVLAAYQLEGNTDTWWQATRDTVFPEGIVPKWNTFLEVFNDKYFSDSAREVKMAKFQRLCQGTMTIDQYEVMGSD
ncbi:hypothetical protein ACJRO7_010390 [Eucalyptus globulus]|uniref:Retrotransposon gag domain-containing protein n=1 Tax=Eucalyptus globulus TaxID=34317 RepID=A0ABD3LCY7_EUCGL